MALIERWDSPFDAARVRGFFGRARYGVAAYAYRTTKREVCEQLAPVVVEAFDVFKEKRPDLEPW